MEAIHFSLSFGKTNFMFHHVASKDEEEEEETIHLSFIVENNLLSHVEATTEEETIISLSCGSSFSCGAENETTIILLIFFLFHV
jgi:hypothetical protein